MRFNNSKNNADIYIFQHSNFQGLDSHHGYLTTMKKQNAVFRILLFDC